MTTNTYGLTPEQAALDARLWGAEKARQRKQERRAADRAVARGLLMFLTLGASELAPAVRAW